MRSGSWHSLSSPKIKRIEHWPNRLIYQCRSQFQIKQRSICSIIGPNGLEAPASEAAHTSLRGSVRWSTGGSLRWLAALSSRPPCPQPQWHLVASRTPAHCWPALRRRPPPLQPMFSHDSTDARVPLPFVRFFDAWMHTRFVVLAFSRIVSWRARAAGALPVLCVLMSFFPAPPVFCVSPSRLCWALGARPPPPSRHPPCFCALFWSCLASYFWT